MGWRISNEPIIINERSGGAEEGSKDRTKHGAVAQETRMTQEGRLAIQENTRECLRDGGEEGDPSVVINC